MLVVNTMKYRGPACQQEMQSFTWDQRPVGGQREQKNVKPQQSAKFAIARGLT